MRPYVLRFVVPALAFAPVLLIPSLLFAQPASTPLTPGTAPTVQIPMRADPIAATESVSGDSTAVRQVGGAVSAPSLLHRVNPQFSEEARKARFSGTVLVNLIVDANGMPQNVHVIDGAGMGLDEKAVEAVKQYTSRPAMENGKPVPVHMNVQVNFQILDYPKIIHSVPAKLTDLARQQNFRGFVDVALTVDENGLPQDVHVTQIVGMGLDENAVKAVQQYRFKPILSNGVPISVPSFVAVHFK